MPTRPPRSSHRRPSKHGLPIHRNPIPIRHYPSHPQPVPIRYKPISNRHPIPVDPNPAEPDPRSAAAKGIEPPSKAWPRGRRPRTRRSRAIKRRVPRPGHAVLLLLLPLGAPLHHHPSRAKEPRVPLRQGSLDVRRRRGLRLRLLPLLLLLVTGIRRLRRP
ncbi:hypothetical protein B0T18DRAFT_400449 [Schizothecium vesticola]|uniref:Uncharacterized protein n=1 Tax=Schizothecium vesticola TaxID=314040 RepID=A0AA40FBZ8_9PEZI|nr:hypothetical protein B0T18DRAFT_400449 [Schizothecium vesticola]